MSRSLYFKSPFEVDFTLKCHFTIRQYICTHKTYSNKPYVTHVMSCPWNCPAGAKHRCGNMAGQARVMQIAELCSKCRPYTLGTDKRLRDLEVPIEEARVKEGEIGNGDGPSGVNKPATMVSEAERVSEATQQMHVEGNDEPDKVNKPEPGNEDQKRDKWIGITKGSSTPSSDNGLSSKCKSWIGSILTPSTPNIPTDTVVPKVTEIANAEASNREREDWQEIEQDPDWDNLNRREVKRDEKKKLWRDLKDEDEQWINVNRT